MEEKPLGRLAQPPPLAIRRIILDLKDGFLSSQINLINQTWHRHTPYENLCENFQSLTEKWLDYFVTNFLEANLRTFDSIALRMLFCACLPRFTFIHLHPCDKSLFLLCLKGVRSIVCSILMKNNRKTKYLNNLIT